MQRRSFIHASAASVLIPVAGRPGLAALVVASSNRDYVFFDERFEKAQRIVASWAVSTQPTPVHSDITAVWQGGLDRTMRDHAVRVRGVTTQSFLFCLRILAAEQADIEAQMSRLDRDLLVWKMRTVPRNSGMKVHHG